MFLSLRCLFFWLGFWKYRTWQPPLYYLLKPAKRNKMDLVYDLEGNFLYRNMEMPSEDLPITVMAVVNQSYPGYVMNNMVNLQDWGEEVKYEIALGGNGHGLEIVITEDGTVLWECDDF